MADRRGGEAQEAAGKLANRQRSVMRGKRLLQFELRQYQPSSEEAEALRHVRRMALNHPRRPWHDTAIGIQQGFACIVPSQACRLMRRNLQLRISGIPQPCDARRRSRPTRSGSGSNGAVRRSARGDGRPWVRSPAYSARRQRSADAHYRKGSHRGRAPGQPKPILGRFALETRPAPDGGAASRAGHLGRSSDPHIMSTNIAGVMCLTSTGRAWDYSVGVAATCGGEDQQSPIMPGWARRLPRRHEMKRQGWVHLELMVQDVGFVAGFRSVAQPHSASRLSFHSADTRRGVRCRSFG